MPRSQRQRISDTLHDIAALVQEADNYLSETGLFKSLFRRPALKKQEKNGIEPNKRDLFSRLERRLREKAIPTARDIFRARRERKARSRYYSLRGAMLPPRKIFGTRFRLR